MSITLISRAVSALDTPTSLLPFFVKDAFDISGRTLMAQGEGGKHEAREKFIEEAGTSLFWIGGIPAFRAVANKFAKNKIDSEIQFKRVNTDGIQGYFAGDVLEKVKEEGKEVEKKKFSLQDLEGIELGGKKLQEVQKKLTGSGFKVNLDKGFYKKYHVGVTAGAVIFNLIMLMVTLPKLNQLLSRKIISKEVKANQETPNEYMTTSFRSNDKAQFNNFLNNSKNDKQSFGALKDLVEFKTLFNFEEMAEKAQLNPVNGMLLLDYGISGSRVTIVPRNNNERVEYAVKEAGIIFFFYYAADIIKQQLAKLANKFMKTPIDLDYKILNSPEFLNKLKNPHKKEEVLGFVSLEKEDKNAELKVIKMIDKELASTPSGTKKDEVFKNFTLQMAQKEGLINVEFDESLNKWIRHSKKYIQTDKVIELNNNLITFYEQAVKNSEGKGIKASIENILAKTKRTKIGSVFANMAICSASLSFIVPKIQYMIREHRTQTKAAPGIKQYQEMAAKNLI